MDPVANFSQQRALKNRKVCPSWTYRWAVSGDTVIPQTGSRAAW